MMRRIPPERGGRPVYLAGGCCTTCCCCSCCLHTFGGLVGAARGASIADVMDAPWAKDQASALYWITLLQTAVAVFVLVTFTSGLLMAFGAMILGLPVVQLLAAVIAFVRAGGQPGTSEMRVVLVSMAIGGVLGALAGGVLIAVGMGLL